MYRHPRVMQVMGEAEQIVADLFAPLPVLARRSAGRMAGGRPDGETKPSAPARIGNFIAGMTDRFALIEHQRLFDSTPDLR